jgi:hypothetical protein
MRVRPVSTSEWLFSELDKHIKNVIKINSNKNYRINKIKNIFKNELSKK